MSEVKDTPVKVFGWTITSVISPVCEDPLSSSSPVLHEKQNSSSSSSSSSPTIEPHMMNKEFATDNTSLKISSNLNKESKDTSEDSDDQQHSEITTITSEEEKPTELKKPEKILPCPRCNSADTKFCYYNNYNVNQPRHFCRNCQRYWTAGGSMRTVPVGSGRRKNKGWVSSDHYLHAENTDNYNNSSTKFLSFDSSESVVTEDAKRQSSNDGSVSQKLNNFPGFLPPQVESSVSPPWPYQYHLNPSFYHMPVYWGCAVPFWSTQETSTCLGKRTRESKDGSVRTRLDSESGSINNEATHNHMWCPVLMNHEKTEQLRMFINESQAKSNNNRVIPEKFLNM